MADLGIIGGSGLTRLHGLEIQRREVMHTPYGEPSCALTFGILSGREVVFLARHGYGHTIPPHMVNYRANLWALREAGAGQLISVCAVGGIRADFQPGAIAIPDQVIDYTWSRDHTLFEKDLPGHNTTGFSSDATIGQLFPRGIDAVDPGEIIRSVFLSLKRQDSTNNVRR